MIGAIIGDTVGSVYEWDNHRSKEFKLFDEECFLTDDSIMTLAVMEIMKRRLYKDENIIIDIIKKWGRAYPARGYGGRFGYWLDSNERESYNSWGNGAAMRISPVGFYARSEEEVREAAHNITAITHSHPEALKGAEVVAMIIYYALRGKDKSFLKEYASKYYNLDFDYEELKKSYSFNESTQGTVPQAIYCFLISTDYEDAIRTAISIGGDSDTLACITGGMAEAYYKHIPDSIIDELYSFIPEDSGDCSPMELIDDYIDERLSILATIEYIDITTIVLAKRDSFNNLLSFSYAHSKDLLIDYMIDCYRYDIVVKEESINKLSSLRNKSINEINSYLEEIENKYSNALGFRLYNKAEALKLVDAREEASCTYSLIFNKSYKLKEMN